MIIGIIIGFILFPIVSWLVSNIIVMSTIVNGQRINSGTTHGGKFIKEGQLWNLKEDIHPELKAGIYIVAQYYDDSILLTREDDKHFHPQGCSPVYYFDILDNPNFELIKENK